jgi:hypothetical protein
VESSCELGNEPSGSIKCWELPRGCTSCGLSSGTQLHRVSLIIIIIINVMAGIIGGKLNMEGTGRLLRTGNTQLWY